MFQLLPCSQCQRTFSVRQELSDAALLKCPNCGHQFRLGELLDALYAPWQVLEDPLDNLSQNRVRVLNESSSNANATWLSHSEPLSEETQLAIEQRVEQVEEGLHLTQDKELSQKVDWSDFKPSAHDNHARRRTKQSGGLRSTLQVILGGAAAIPVSLLLIWYVLGKDVAGAGPQVARYLPWIVPKQFHGNSTTVAPLSGPRANPTPRGTASFRNLDEAITPQDASSRETLSEPAFTTSPEMPATAPTETDRAVAPKEPQESAPTDTKEARRSVESPKSANSDGLTPAPSAAEEIIDEAPLPRFIKSIQQTRQLVLDWSGEDQPANSTAASQTQPTATRVIFDELAKLGEAYAKLPEGAGSPAALQELIKDLGRQIKRKTNLPEQLRLQAEVQLNEQSPRVGQGLALVCTIEDTQEQADQWWVSVGNPGLRSPAFPVVAIPKQLAPRPSAGEQRLLIGNFVSASPAFVAAESETSNDQPNKLMFRVSFTILL